MMGGEIKTITVIKRDGSKIDFFINKVKNAILKALSAVKNDDKKLAEILAKDVLSSITRSRKKEMHVEAIQDIVERTLMKHNLPDAAKAYIIYRHEREKIRNAKNVSDDLKLSVNAMKVLSARYLLRDETGNITETPTEMFRRVAKSVDVDKKYEEDYYQLLCSRDFLPNTPTLMNAGTKMGQLSACFVIPIEDSLENIFDAVKTMALIHQSGGGTGFSFSRLRPKGEMVGTTHGVASGPVSFMRIFNETTEVIKQGGKRRGANMGILNVDHPDVFDFISCKSEKNFLNNFNISVAVSDKFMHAVENDYEFELVNPKTKKAVKSKKAREIFNMIAANAWKNGDPGMLFIDRINRHNTLPSEGRIEATNPCGEQPLLPYESCNLGSINLLNFVDDSKGQISWTGLKKTVNLAVRFLDNVIDANKYILPEIKKITKRNRKIGLGVMGFAEMLIKLNIPYDSEEALHMAKRVMEFIQKEARKTSEELGKEKGNFPSFKKSRLAKEFKNMRNATMTTIAPTGTISIIADCTSGIEPLFAVAFVRNVLEGSKLVEINKEFEKIAKERGFYSEELIRKITKDGSVQNLKEVPADVKKIFRTALDISPEWHVKMQAQFQKNVDNAVSKTVNLKYDATIDDVKKVYLLANKLGCKGITVYRYGSKKDQVLYSGANVTNNLDESENVTVHSEFSGGCPTFQCNY